MSAICAINSNVFFIFYGPQVYGLKSLSIYICTIILEFPSGVEPQRKESRGCR